MSTTCAHGEEQGLAGDPLVEALLEAEAVCDRYGQRLTAPRRRVLELLLGSGGPVKAYDLMASYGGEGGPAKPPTVYRALEFLERQGFAHRIESLNAYVACRRANDTEGVGLHGAAFLICDCCGTAREAPAPALADVERLSAEAGFSVRSLVMEARGLCAACQAESA
jgi:Fur family zinc uptake transcriptional regulator